MTAYRALPGTDGHLNQINLPVGSLSYHSHQSTVTALRTFQLSKGTDGHHPNQNNTCLSVPSATTVINQLWRLFGQHIGLSTWQLDRSILRELAVSNSQNLEPNLPAPAFAITVIKSTVTAFQATPRSIYLATRRIDSDRSWRFQPLEISNKTCQLLPQPSRPSTSL